MKWTTPADLRVQVQRLWDRGLILASLCGGEDLFPRRLNLRTPKSAELSTHYTEVRAWIERLASADAHYRIEWRTLKHRVLGSNDIPARIWIDTLDAALKMIHKRQEAEQFRELLQPTRERQAELLPWVRKHPLRALELASEWEQLMALVSWIQQHPRPDIYLRQIELSGVHTKFIEQHRATLAQMFDLVLPPSAIDATYTGVSGFCRRYGFLDKPARVRFRILDPAIRVLRENTAQDITLTRDAFAHLDPPVSRVFITENEINFLAFPPTPSAMVIFGSGYGFDHLAPAAWLQHREVYYWGDIDTHGFAILNQVRKILPHTISFLMDAHTLLAHRPLWGTEPQPGTGELKHLNAEEQQVYKHLRQNYWGEGVRLEQERIRFDFLRNILLQFQL